MNCKHEKTHWIDNYKSWNGNDEFSIIEKCSNCGLEWNTTYKVIDRDEIEEESK